jgi:hypothetical protein
MNKTLKERLKAIGYKGPFTEGGLIEVLGDDFEQLYNRKGVRFEAYSPKGRKGMGCGTTPRDALAQLYLLVNNK